VPKLVPKTNDQVSAEADVESFHDDHGPFVVAVEETRMAMVFTDATEVDNPLIFANDSFLALTGYSRTEVLGQSFDFLLAHAADDTAAAEIAAQFSGKSEDGAEVLYRRKDGSEFWVALFVSPVSNEGGDIVQYFASFVDITKHRDEQTQSRMLIDELTIGSKTRLRLCSR